MKVCIAGAGAIGAFIGTRLALAGESQVSVLARGATLAAIRQHGLRLQQAGELHAAPVAASDNAADLGVQDVVVIAVKGPALAAVADACRPLIGPHTLLLPAMNGVTWWFGAGCAAIGDAPLQSIDPGGRIAAALPLAQVIGCVVHASVATEGGGLARHVMGQGLIIGEPVADKSGGVSARVTQLAALLQRAGFDCTASADIRRDIWFKLWGNMTMNPVTALTGATVDKVLDDPLTRHFCSQAMLEAQAVGARIGCAIDQTPEDRHAIARKLGAFKTSMLQDVEANRPVELEALVGAVRELAQRVGVATPTIDTLYGLARLQARVRGLLPG